MTLGSTDFKYPFFGYLEEESGDGFRTPIFSQQISGNTDIPDEIRSSLYYCVAAPSGEIKEFLPLPSGFLQSVKKVRKPYVANIGRNVPLVHIEGDKVDVVGLSSAHQRILARALHKDTSPYLRLSYCAVLSLPSDYAKTLYSELKPVYAQSGWEKMQQQSYDTQQKGLLGNKIFETKHEFAKLENEVLTKLSALLGKYKLSDFGRNSDTEPRETSTFVENIIFSIAERFLAFQTLADDSNASRNSAIRRLFAGLGRLDKLGQTAKSDSEINLLKQTQLLLFIPYCVQVSMNFKSSYSEVSEALEKELYLSFAEALVAENRFINATERFKIINTFLFENDERIEMEVSNRFFGVLSGNQNKGFIVTRKNGDFFVVQEGLVAKNAIGEGRNGDIVRVEHLNDGTVTMRGKKFTENTLELYYPTRGYKGEFKSDIFASNSWFMSVCSAKTKSAILLGAKNNSPSHHSELVKQMGVSRFLLITAVRDSITFLKGFVNDTWKDLKVEEDNEGRISISFNPQSNFEGQIAPMPTMAKLIGFYRAVNVVINLWEPMQELNGKLNFYVFFKGNDATQVDWESAHSKYMASKNESVDDMATEVVSASTTETEVPGFIAGWSLFEFLAEFAVDKGKAMLRFSGATSSQINLQECDNAFVHPSSEFLGPEAV